MRLEDAIPHLSSEISGLLRASEYPGLADQVPNLDLVARCRCGERSCSMFYTEPPPTGAYGNGHWTLMLDANKGMLILDLIERRIVAVEVLDRPDVEEKLTAALP